MALAPCQTAVDSSGRELVEHGTTGLPVACYHDDLGRRDVPWHWHDELEAAVVTEGCAVVSAGESKRVGMRTIPAAGFTQWSFTPGWWGGVWTARSTNTMSSP